jgi:hypothetical protein
LSSLPAFSANNNSIVKKLAQALKLPRDTLSFQIIVEPNALAVVKVEVPIVLENVEMLARIIEEEKIMVGGDVALYGHLMSDKNGKIENDFAESDFDAEAHY